MDSVPRFLPSYFWFKLTYLGPDWLLKYFEYAFDFADSASNTDQIVAICHFTSSHSPPPGQNECTKEAELR